MKIWLIILIMLLATLGPSLVIGLVGYASIRALARNPSAAPKIQISMMLAFLFAVTIAVVALLVVSNVLK